MSHRLFSTLILTLVAHASLFAQTTEFTYQGSLKDGPNIANGNYDFEFRLFDSLVMGNQIGALQSRTGVAVTGGTFSVQLDFGSVFPGADRYIDIQVRASGGGGYTPLNPRQRVNSAPYGLKALIADSANNASALGGIGPGGFIRNSITAQIADFNVTGTGVVNGNLFVFGTAQINNVSATSHFSLGTSRVLSNPGPENIFVGAQAGWFNSTGGSNSFLGFQAGASNLTGNNNSFFGRTAGAANTSGSDNAFFGTAAGQSSNGNYNAFFGMNAGRSNTTGSNNSFFGGGVGGVGGTGYNNTTGNFNSFFGHRAGEANNVGNLNSFIGTGAGFMNTSGSSNTFVGHNAGAINQVGSFNTLVGENANVNSVVTNSTAIGSKASVWQSNSIVLGSVSGVNGATVGVSVGVGTVAPAHKLHVIDSSNTGLRVQTNAAGGTVASFGAQGVFQVDAPGVPGGRLLLTEDGRLGLGNVGGTPTDRLEIYGYIRTLLGSAGSTSLCYNNQSQISTCSSSLRYKKNVSVFTPGLALISRLRPVAFDWVDGGSHDLGLVAEEVAAIEPLMTSRNRSGQIEGVKYDRIGVVLINAVNEQQVQIENLSKQLTDEKTRNAELQSQIDALTKLVCASNRVAALCTEVKK